MERPLARVHPVAAGKLELLQRTRGSRVYRMGLPVHRHAALMQVQQERGQTHGVYHFSWTRGDILFCSRRLDVRVVCVQSSLKSYFPVGTNVFASSTNHRSDSWNIHISVVFRGFFFFFSRGLGVHVACGEMSFNSPLSVGVEKRNVAFYSRGLDARVVFVEQLEAGYCVRVLLLPECFM